MVTLNPKNLRTAEAHASAATAISIINLLEEVDKIAIYAKTGEPTVDLMRMWWSALSQVFNRLSPLIDKEKREQMIKILDGIGKWLDFPYMKTEKKHILNLNGYVTLEPKKLAPRPTIYDVRNALNELNYDIVLEGNKTKFFFRIDEGSSGGRW